MTGDDDVIVEFVEKDRALSIPKWALAIPEWVPSYVAKFARLTWTVRLADAVEGPILKRLLTDPRMRPFYEYLTARRKRDGRYKLSARFPTPEMWAEDSARQDEGIRWIIWHALCSAVDKAEVAFQAKVDAKRAERQELALKVQELAEALEYQERWGDSPYSEVFHTEGSKLLDAAADIIEKVATETGVGWTVVDRKSHDLEAHAFAILIASEFQFAFGNPAYRLTATVTSVALNLEVNITWERVRDWWKAHQT
jgi:hypothetical protein